LATTDRIYSSWPMQKEEISQDAEGSKGSWGFMRHWDWNAVRKHGCAISLSWALFAIFSLWATASSPLSADQILIHYSHCRRQLSPNVRCSSWSFTCPLGASWIIAIN
jgi:hypothetical protein